MSEIKKFSENSVAAISPTDGSLIAKYPVATNAAVDAAYAAARVAQSQWQQLPYKERATAMRNARNAFVDNAEQIVNGLSQEVGRSEAESWFAEVLANVELFDYWIGNANQYLQPERVKLNPLNYPGKKGWIEYVPRGVIGLVTPWNFPVAIPLRAIIPGLLAGNAIVWKPSEHSAHISNILFSVLQPHFPDGLIQLMQGGGSTGQAVVNGADLVIFTGSVPTGRAIAQACAAVGTPCALELGGKDAAYVAPDAPFDRTVAGLVWGAFNNAGQNCASVERIYVHGDIYDKFIAAYQQELQSILDRGGLQVGPMVNQQQVEVVKQHLEGMQTAGAKVVVGGTIEGQQVTPAMICDANDEMEGIVEETFGPLAPIMKVDSVDEAIERINHSRFGLTTSFWTQDYVAAAAWKDRVKSGVVTVNNHSFTAAIAGAPWVGVDDSGTGVTNSHLALHEMVRPRFYLEDRNKATRELWWYPYSDNAVDLAKAVLDTLRPGFKSPMVFIKALKKMGKRFD